MKYSVKFKCLCLIICLLCSVGPEIIAQKSTKKKTTTSKKATKTQAVKETIINTPEQNNAAIESINNYINFTNESIHGLLIVHRLLENFNKNINKFVDLPDGQINFYSNKDLPKDIFQDDENWFYDTSPNEWKAILHKENKVIPSHIKSKLDKSVATLHTINQSVNNLRFELENLIGSLDLTKRENLSKVYDKLEEGVVLYKKFYIEQKLMEEVITKYVKSIPSEVKPYNELLVTLQDVYTSTRVILDALYSKKDEKFGQLLEKQKTAIAKFNTKKLTDYNTTKIVNSKMMLYWNNIKKQLGELEKIENAFYESENIPEEYKLYDKYYYYYNIATINKFNKYGNGIVFEMNRIVDYLNEGQVKFFEVPHYFKVIYPKLLDSTSVLKASDPIIESIPAVVKGRNVVMANRTIKADSEKIKFSIYDHKIVDKDIVSLSYNGDWIIEKFEISAKPHEFTIQLNKNGKNFLLLHADDMGRNPPATIALSYTYKGKKETIILNSDTLKSETIEIVVDNNQ